MRGYIYIEAVDQSDFERAFDSIPNSKCKTFPQKGGVVEERKYFEYQKKKFYGVSFKGDLIGWSQNIRENAEIENRQIATVDPENKGVFIDSVSVDVNIIEY